MKNHLYSLYQMVLKSLNFYLGIDQEKKKAGRPPTLCLVHPILYHKHSRLHTG